MKAFFFVDAISYTLESCHVEQYLTNAMDKVIRVWPNKELCPGIYCEVVISYSQIRMVEYSEYAQADFAKKLVEQIKMRLRSCEFVIKDPVEKAPNLISIK